MKRFLSPLASVFMLGMIGCANEGPTGPELQEQIARGVRGEGQLGPEIDRTNDPYVRPRDPTPPPRE